jgi:hypothetical protein
MPISPLQKEGLVQRLKNASGIIYVVDFGTSRKPIDNMEPMRVPHDCKHELFPFDMSPSFCCHLIFGQSPHSTRPGEKGKPGLIARHQMPETIFLCRFSIGNH